MIPGDGVGEEITPAALKVLEAVADITGSFTITVETFPWGSKYYLSHGRMMAKDGLKSLESFDAIYFGAVGWPTVPDHITLHGLRLAICQGFDQYANVRPAVLLPGIRSPLSGKQPGDIDIVVIRENTEGEYSGSGGRVHQGSSLEVATEIAVFTRHGAERIIRYAFNEARNRPRKLLTCVTKSNAQRYGFVMWDQVCEDVRADYPDVTVDRMLVDAMAARIVLKPESLDVVVASNLHADILTDLTAAVCGGLGLAPSGNINPARTYPSMFEPIHGSAPDIYGKGIANPIGMIWSGALMLAHLGEEEAAQLITSAIMETTTAGQTLTPDIGGQATTIEVANTIIARLRDLSEDA